MLAVEDTLINPVTVVLPCAMVVIPVTAPPIYAFPLTDNLSAGVVLPIPTLPLAAIRMRSLAISEFTVKKFI